MIGHFLSLAILALAIGTADGQSTGFVVGWGDRIIVEPAALDGFIAVAGGGSHSLGLVDEHTVAVAFSSVAADSRDGAIVLRWGAVQSTNDDRIFSAGLGTGASRYLRYRGALSAASHR